MQVAYFGGDWFLACLTAWQKHGYRISHVFTHGEMHYNQQLRGWASTNQAELQTTQPTTEEIRRLSEQGVEILFCIEYPWLIPTQDTTCKTINVHPSMLPDGRGSTPLSWILHSYPDCAGVTFHQMTSVFDQGAIIYQEPIAVADNDTLDTLLGKLELEIPIMLNHLIANLEHFYQQATPQSTGSSWPKMTLKDRKIDWSSDVRAIRSQVRAAGHFGVVVAIENELLLVKHLQCVTHPHSLNHGVIFKEDTSHYYITCIDGICVIDKQSIIESKAIGND